MNRRWLFVQLVGLSLRVGWIAGAVLSCIVGSLCALLLGPIALGLALLVGIVAGVCLGLLNGLFIGAITCLWFVPLRNAGFYSQVIGASCVVANIVGLFLAQQYVAGVFLGPVAWYGSQFVCDWYEEANRMEQLREPQPPAA